MRILIIWENFDLGVTRNYLFKKSELEVDEKILLFEILSRNTDCNIGMIPYDTLDSIYPIAYFARLLGEEFPSLSSLVLSHTIDPGNKVETAVDNLIMPDTSNHEEAYESSLESVLNTTYSLPENKISCENIVRSGHIFEGNVSIIKVTISENHRTYKRGRTTK